MIKSKFNMASGLAKILKDPESLKKDLESLQKAEKRVKSATKELYEGKSKKAYLDSVDKKVKEAELRLKKVEDECCHVLHEQKAAVESIGQDIELAETSLRSRSAELQAKELEVSDLEKVVKGNEVKVNAALKKAKSELASYQKLKKSYEEKLEDIKKRLSGIEG